MAEFDLVNDDYNLALNYSGEYMGQIIQVQRPVYTQVDGTPTNLTKQRIKLERTRGNLAQPEFRNLEYYAIFGYRYAYQPGDLLVAQGVTSTPICTIVSFSPVEEAVAVRTSRVGSIYNGTIPLFTTVYFDQIAEDKPSSQDFPQIEMAPKISHKRFIIYKRSLTTITQEAEGLLFYENDLPGNPHWSITQVDSRGDLMILDCIKTSIF